MTAQIIFLLLIAVSGWGTAIFFAHKSDQVPEVMEKRLNGKEADLRNKDGQIRQLNTQIAALRVDNDRLEKQVKDKQVKINEINEKPKTAAAIESRRKLDKREAVAVKTLYQNPLGRLALKEHGTTMEDIAERLWVVSSVVSKCARDITYKHYIRKGNTARNVATALEELGIG